MHMKSQSSLQRSRGMGESQNGRLALLPSAEFLSVDELSSLHPSSCALLICSLCLYPHNDAGGHTSKHHGRVGEIQKCANCACS